MAIYPQRLTIYLYSAHRAVIFAIAQLSCPNRPLPICFFRQFFGTSRRSATMHTLQTDVRNTVCRKRDR